MLMLWHRIMFTDSGDNVGGAAAVVVEALVDDVLLFLPGASAEFSDLKDSATSYLCMFIGCWGLGSHFTTGVAILLTWYKKL